jgi:hypothetical protein
MTWMLYYTITRSPSTITLILLVLAGPNEDVPLSISTMFQEYFGRATSALERRQEQRRRKPSLPPSSPDPP